MAWTPTRNTPQVLMLTWCRDPAAMYGSLLTLKTIRVGFPTANITIVENASIPEARSAISAGATACGARFVQLEAEVTHHDFIADCILRHPSGPLVFLDPDLSFWRSVEGWSFSDSVLMAGRLIPAFRCEYTRTITQPRLHTSFLWIPDAARLRAELLRIRGEHWEWSPFAPTALVHDGEWCRWDSGASIYAAAKQHMQSFSETELEAYDHLFVGSHLSIVAPSLDSADAARLVNLHASVKNGDWSALRGAWRWQEELFRRRSPELTNAFPRTQ